MGCEVKSLHFVASICHPAKLGLLDLAKALNHYGLAHDQERDYIILEDVFHLICLVRKLRKLEGTGICVVWDNSLRSLLIALIARALGIRIAYYYHEPGGFGQKIFKSDPLFYSLKATLGEWIFLKASHYHIVARPDKIGFGDVFCPLLYSDSRPEFECPPEKLIGFLGAKRNQRLYNLFILLEPKLKRAGYQIAFFPSTEYGSSTEEKFEFLSRCSAVWNVYGVPYNQSGVTGDCLMSGTPVIHSSFEPFRSLLNELNLGIELDLFQTCDVMILNLLKNLDGKSLFRNDIERIRLSTSKSNFGGQQAFLKYWKPYFDGIVK